MAKLSPQQIAQLAAATGFSGDGLIIAIAVALAESGGNTTIVNVAGNSPASRDRGLWQINDYWHREVSDTCAFDAACNARETYRISKAGTNWRQWATYTNGAYARHLAVAQQAAGAAPVGSTSPQQLTYTLHALTGNRMTRQGDVPDLGRLGTVDNPGSPNGISWNDVTVGITLPPGLTVTLYEHGDFRGEVLWIVSGAGYHDIRHPTIRNISYATSIRIGAHGTPKWGTQTGPGGSSGGSGGNWGGSESPVTSVGFAGIAERIARAEQLRSDIDADAEIRLGFPVITLPNPLGSDYEFDLSTNVKIPGTGLAKSLLRNAKALVVRLIVMLVGMFCVLVAVRNS